MKQAEKIGRVNLAPRFLREYAAYMIRGASGAGNIVKAEYNERINRIVRACVRGYITPSEAVVSISGAMDAVLRDLDARGVLRD